MFFTHLATASSAKVSSLGLGLAVGIDANSKREARGNGCAKVLGSKWRSGHVKWKPLILVERGGRLFQATCHARSLVHVAFFYHSTMGPRVSIL